MYLDKIDKNRMEYHNRRKQNNRFTQDGLKQNGVMYGF